MSMTSLDQVRAILAALLDGVDGFESEHGYLRYWSPEAVRAARSLFEGLTDQDWKQVGKAAEALGLALPHNNDGHTKLP